jgi:hypothetical protein
MDHPSTDVAILILKKLNITTIRTLWNVNKFWYEFLKHRMLTCMYHHYHCKKCASSIFKWSKQGKTFHIDKTVKGCECLNCNVINKCNNCHRTFCKHLRRKKCSTCHRIYDRNSNICALCTSCFYCSNTRANRQTKLIEITFSQ